MRLINSTDQDEKEFAAYLLDIGNGEVEESSGEVSDSAEKLISLPAKFLSTAKTVTQFCSEIYPNLKNKVKRGLRSDDNDWHDWLMERAIICPTNKDVNHINNTMIEDFPGDVHVYKSHDKLVNDDNAHEFPVEYLNTIEVNGCPPHLLKLKVGAPIMLMRNLDPTRGHVNGTRYIVKALHPRVIHAVIAVGPYKGNELMIPRIPFHPEDRTLPIEMERRQFPVRLCFGVTSNKSQGQTLKYVGIYLEQQDFFSHGQLYVAESRVQSVNNLKIFKPREENQTHPNTLVNVVFKEVLICNCNNCNTI